MTILRRITEGIDTHRRYARTEPDMVVLGEAAFRKLLDEGSVYTVATEDAETTPSTVHGIPIKVLPDVPANYVGILGPA